MKSGIKSFPAIGLFRNGHFLEFEDEVDDEKVVLRWMTAEETLKIAGIIDEVNSAMLENILTEENDAFVFFYDKSDPEAHTILEELEQGRRSVLLVFVSPRGNMARRT